MRPSLTKLVAQIGEIIGQSSEDSHSGATQSQSDGGLRMRLRTVLLSLLDGIMGTGTAAATPAGKEVASMLKLLTITLTRSSSLLVDGDGGASLLPEVLERLLPLLTRPKLADLHGEVADIACRILSLLARTAPGLAAALARGTLTLFEDVFEVAGVLSTQPELSASVACYAGALRSTDSAEPPLQLRLDGPTACECLLVGLLRMLGHSLRLRPLALGAALGPLPLDHARTLLLSNSTSLQAGAMQLLAVALDGAPLAPCSPTLLLDTLAVMLQRRSQGQLVPEADTQAQRQEWWQALAALLRVLVDRATADPAATQLLLPRVLGLAAASAAACTDDAALQLSFCQLCRAALLAQPGLFEGCCGVLLRLFPEAAPACGSMLAECVALYLRHQWQLCGGEAVAAAIGGALTAAGLAAEAAPAAPADPGEEGRSARKRRRVRVSPLRASQQAPASKLAQNLHPPGPGLAAVAAAVARLAAQLAAGCGQQPLAAESASALALLLGVLCPQTPREAVAIGMALLPPVLQQGAASGWHGCGGDGAQLASLLRLALSALEAVLVSAAGQGDTAAAAVSPVSPPQLLAALQQAWVADVSADEAQAATAAAAPAESSRVAAMCACLAAVQADLLDPADMLGLLRRELQGYLQHDTASASNTGSDLEVAAAAATLLPAACVIGAAREHQLASQPRATQGGRRQKQAQAHQAHPPSPLVSALHKLVSSASEAPPAGLSFADAAAERQRRQAVLAALARGLLCVVSHAQDPHLALAAIDAACSKGSGTSAWALLQMLQGPLGCAAEAECHPPSLPSGVSEWVRLALERLTAAELPNEGQAMLVGAVASFLQRAAQSQLEHAKPLVQWLVRKAASQQVAVRNAVLRRAALFAEPQVILTLCHDGEHPIHTKDREALVESLEHQMLQALREKLEALEAPAAGSGRSASSIEATREGLVQILGCAGSRMRSPTANQLLMGIMIVQLDKEQPVRAIAAEVLQGIAEQRRAPLRELVCSSQKFLAFLARNVRDNAELTAELADILGVAPRGLVIMVMPQALPMLMAEQNRDGLEQLAQQAGVTLHRLLQEYGHCVIARELFEGAPNFDSLIEFAESITGQDSVEFLSRSIGATVKELVTEAGGAEDWGSGVALPDAVLQRCSMMLGELADMYYKCSGVSVAEFLAEGDHATRMLKHWGDLLDRRLPPPTLLALGASVADASQHAQQQLGGHSQAAAAAQPHVAPADVRACITTLRCTLLLTRLTGRFIGRFLPQLMVLLTAGVRPANPREVKLQCLEGWLGLVRALAQEAPVQLGGVVNQVVVALLESLQEGGPVSAAAIRVLEELVLICRRTHREKLRTIPPLPNWLQELEKLNETLAKERGKLSTQEQIELLVASLADESLAVRATALRELRSVLSSRRERALGLLGAAGPTASGGDASTAHTASSSGTASLLSRLMSALLKCCDPEVHSQTSLQAQQACAECLGILGAVDPARVSVELQPPAQRCTSDGELLVTLIARHLVRLLKTAPNLQVLDGATLAIQELLRNYSRADGLDELAAQQAAQQAAQGGSRQGQGQSSREVSPANDGVAEGNLLFAALAPEVQAIVRPYLDSKYHIRGVAQRPRTVLFGSAPGMSMRQWLFLWFSQLVQHHASGNQLKLFQSVMPACRFDIPACLFLMPYLLHNVLAHGTDDARQSVQQEIKAVLAGASMSREGTLCCQAVFSLLDTLQRWHGDAKKAAQAEQQHLGVNDPGRAGESGEHLQLGPQWDCIEQLLGAMPKQLLAQAASQCGAHARSLQYFETHVRTLHSGALNPAAHRSASYGDAEVSYLQEVYGKLEDPDGLQGLVRLRQGGPRPEDQRLAAEKAGNWSEALTLYEQALQHSGGTAGSGRQAAGAAAAAGLLDGAGGAGGGSMAGPGEAGLGAMQRGYLDCLLHMGHLQGLLTQVEGLAGEARPSAAGQLAALGAAASWRLGQWERVKGYAEIASQTYSQLDADARWEVRMARLLWSVAHRDFDALQRDLQRARSEVMGPFSAAAMESYSRAYPHLVKLHMLQEIADVAGGLQRGQGPLERHRALRWDERLAATQSSLSTQEPILALRRQLAALSGAAEQAGECWLQLAQLCRGTGHYEAATTAVLEALASSVPRAPLEHVQLLWDKGQPYRAISEATVLVCQAQEHRLAAPFAQEAEHSRFHAQAALQLAQWMAETGQAAQDEITALFDRAITLEPKSETVLFRYAVFLDELMSDARARQEAEKERGEKQKGMDRLVGNARIKLGEDRPFLEILPDVIKSYGMSLQHGSEHCSQSLPRVLTLWFEFGTYLHTFRKGQQPTVNEQQAVAAATQAITAIMTNLAKRVPKSTWLAALPQLISRMCHPCKEVSELARHIIILITQAYPHQSLWSLAAVAKSSVPARRAAASAIANAAKKNMDQKMFAEMTSFCDQLIRLATHQPAKGRTMSARKEFSHLVRSMPLHNIVMPAMSCLSITLPPAAGRGAGPRTAPEQQPELVTVEAIVDSIEVMASLQKPKKVTFVGSDGAHYTFLAKPKDDLRKDNRMMEAAGVVNRLFAGDPAARRRNLYLRRFAVLPIGEDNGIVEWVLNTRGMRHCLTDIYTAAGLYEGNRTNRAIQRIWDGAPQNRRRSEVLDEVLQNWPPLFHRWQLDNFTEPAAWLNARLAYTRTAAVWSMVGHTVGLGDRHGENILIDCSNGDVVHVDFSCLFDKGLTLAKPEMVPFRLTQNVIDGFGVSGVEGLYRRVCEITLGVLRAHRGSILSHIDTFVHDPLVEWVRSGSNSGNGNGNGNGGSKSAAANDEGGDNPHAKDALATIEGRLKGTLLGVKSVPCMPLSVEGQAHRLIEEASSKDNLGMMYIWWMPWM
ncbi:hypothetical protein ABPG77_001622 [Micractinium sp. CCAP 211/92]